jgi:hypothetical protein
MAPELANDAPLAPASDRYALAVVAYELLTGTVPYTGETWAAVLMAHVLQPLSPPSMRNPLLPAAVDEVLSRALAKDPAQRYATASAFVAALTAAAHHEDAGSHPAHVPVLAPPAATPVAPTVAASPPPVSVTSGPAPAARDAGILAMAGIRTDGPAGSASATDQPLPSLARRRGIRAPNPLLLAGLGGAVLVLVIGIVALVHRGGNPVPPNGVWHAAQAMHTARGAVRTVVLHDGRVLVMGGWGMDGPIADAELYDPATGRWTPTGSMHIARHYFTATVLRSGRVLVAGGTDSENYLADAEIYDPRTGSWTVTGSMHIPRDQQVAALLPNGTVLVAGGETTDTTPSAATEIYNPGTGRWASAAPMSTARWDAAATLLTDGTVLVTGGGSASAEIYDPTTGRWHRTGPMSVVRYRHTATLLPDHTVLVAGGESTTTSVLNTAEIYNPHTGAWTAAGVMPHAHSRHTATLLPNGEVLVAGGTTGKELQSLESGIGSVDIYDPVGHRWYAAGAMRSKRAEQGAALLTGGRLLQIGGYTEQGAVTATTELYSAPSSS